MPWWVCGPEQSPQRSPEEYLGQLLKTALQQQVLLGQLAQGLHATNDHNAFSIEKQHTCPSLMHENLSTKLTPHNDIGVFLHKKTA